MSELLTTADAAQKLGISLSQFSRIYRARGYAPDQTREWSYRSRSGTQHLWGARTLAAIARTREVKLARDRRAKLDAAAAVYREKAEREERLNARYRMRLPGKIAALFGSPREALPAACEAVFSLNRSTRAKTYYALKSRLIKHLYDAEVFTDRVEKLMGTLPAKECWGCEGSGCDRCDHTGEFAPPKEVCSYLFAFTIEGRNYIWRQPDFAVSWVPRVEAMRTDDSRGQRADVAPLPERHVWALAALVEYAISVPIDPPEPDDAERDDRISGTTASALVEHGQGVG